VVAAADRFSAVRELLTCVAIAISFGRVGLVLPVGEGPIALTRLFACLSFDRGHTSMRSSIAGVLDCH
jgi:hypothetical protein